MLRIFIPESKQTTGRISDLINPADIIAVANGVAQALDNTGLRDDLAKHIVNDGCRARFINNLRQPANAVVAARGLIVSVGDILSHCGRETLGELATGGIIGSKGSIKCF